MVFFLDLVMNYHCTFSFGLISSYEFPGLLSRSRFKLCSNFILVMIFHGSQSNIILWSVSNFLILVCGCFLGSPQPSLQVYNTK